MPKELRTLCHRCISDYRLAGYYVHRIGTVREPCDKCNRQGVMCEVEDGERIRKKIIQRNSVAGLP